MLFLMLNQLPNDPQIKFVRFDRIDYFVSWKLALQFYRFTLAVYNLHDRN
jgi:hypothetical protein